MAPMPVRLPVAVNCVVSPAKVSATELGTTVSVGVPDPVPEAGTVTVRVAVALSPPDTAVIVVVPAPTDVASPAELMVATCALLETHVTWLVRFCGLPTPVRLPLAINCVVSPANVSEAELGVTVSDGVPDPVVEIVTVTIALELSPPDWAIIIVVPAPVAVASPLELMVATCALLESHVTWVVRFCAPPTPVRFPVAVNCVVSPINVSAASPGRIVIDGMDCVVVVFDITVRSEAAIAPSDATAVISTYPAPTAVANPEELMVATFGLLVDQVTELVTLAVVMGPDPICSCANAVYCAVWPAAVKTSIPGPGTIERAWILLQAVSDRASGKLNRTSRRDARMRRVIGKSPAPKLLSPSRRTPCHFRYAYATFVPNAAGREYFSNWRSGRPGTGIFASGIPCDETAPVGSTRALHPLRHPKPPAGRRAGRVEPARQLWRRLHVPGGRILRLRHLRGKDVARPKHVAGEDHQRLVRREAHIRLLAIVVVRHVDQALGVEYARLPEGWRVERKRIAADHLRDGRA